MSRADKLKRAQGMDCDFYADYVLEVDARVIINRLESDNYKLKEVAKAMRDWIDAVPSDTVLPTMPGFDRDWADNIIDT